MKALLAFLCLMFSLTVGLMLRLHPQTTIAGASPERLQATAKWSFWVACMFVGLWTIERFKSGTGAKLTELSSGKVGVKQVVVSEDKITLYLSYGWQVCCPVCLMIQCIVHNEDPDQVTYSCNHCKANVLIRRFDNVLCFSAPMPSGAKQFRSEELYKQGVLAGVAREWDSAQTAFLEALNLRSTRHLKECLQIIDDVKSGEIDDAVAEHMFRSIQARDGGDNFTALQEVKGALQRAPHYSRAHADLGTYYMSAGRHAEATQEFELASRDSPNFARAHYLRAMAYDYAERPADAEAKLKEALVADGDFGPAHSRLAVLFARMKRFDEARQHRDKAIQQGELLPLEELAIPDRWPYLYQC